MTNIVILDYGLGNVRSLANALRAIDAKSKISREPNVVMEADGLILPGVGAYPKGMQNLKEYDLIPVIQSFIKSGKPVLGICLGMQLLFEKGTEFSVTDGLGIIPGTVERIKQSEKYEKLPHIAWADIMPSNQGKQSIFKGLPENETRYYFVHSYAANNVHSRYLSATVRYCGGQIIAAVEKDNVWGTQFHPEKSGLNGLKLLQNFTTNCTKVKNDG